MLIRKSYCPWSSIALLCENDIKIIRGDARLVINYKPLKALKLTYP